MTTITRTYATHLERIIAEEVLENASQMISELSRNAGAELLVPLEELMECQSAPDYSEAPEGYTVYEESGEGWTYAESDDLMPYSYEYFYTEREAIRAAWEDAGEEPDNIEALQHWIVSDWLADKLEEIGALVSRDILGFNVWGRTECGQGLDYDSDLRQVAALIDRAAGEV